MTTYIEEINKLKPLHIQSTLAVVLSVVAPGYLMVFHFWPNLFFSLDNLKLFFLAISLSLPVLAINWVAVIGAKPFDSEINFGSTYFKAMIISFILLYACLLFAWLLHLSFGRLVLMIFVLEIFAIIISFKFHRRAINAGK